MGLGDGNGNENKDKTQQIADKAIKPVTGTEMTTGHEMEFERWMGKKKLGVTAEWEGLSEGCREGRTASGLLGLQVWAVTETV